MAVFPDRIVLKNSTDPVATIISAIESGGTDEIQAGELVLSREPGKVDIYTLDANGNVISVKGVETLTDLTDVTITSEATNDYLRYNGTQWVNVASSPYDIAQDGGDFDTGTADNTTTIFDIFPISIDAHSDVDTSTVAPTNGQVLSWDGTNWVPSTAAAGGVTSIIAGTGISVDQSTGDVTITATGGGGGATTIDDLTDVDTSTVAPTDGQVLTWDNAAGQWEPADATGGGATSLADLTDTSISSPATGEYLRYSTGIGWRDTRLDITDDPFPGLGGDLAMSSYSLTDTQGNNIKIKPIQGSLEVFGHPSGTAFTGKIKLNCEQNTHGVTIESPPHSAGATYTLTLPTSAGSNGQVLTTDGTGTLSWTTASGGGGGGALNDLSDVTITTPSSAQVLRYNGSGWVNVALSYSDLTGTPTLATVATTGAYSDLTGTPSLAPVATSGAYSDLTGAPTNLSQFTNDSGYLTDISGEALNDLSNVVVPTPTTGDVLSYNGVNWVNSAAPPADISGSSINALNDVDTSTTPPTNGQGLIWNSTSGQWEPGAVSAGPIALDDLTDVDTTTTAPNTGEFLKYDGANWVPGTGAGGGATSIDELTDVDTTTAAPNVGQVLKWDGSNWIPGNDNSGGGGAAELGRGDGGDIDFGTVESAFVFGVYGGGDVDTTTEDKPVEFVSYDVDGGEIT